MHDGGVPAPIRLAVVDDHPLVARAIEAVIGRDADTAVTDRPGATRSIVVVGTAETAVDGIELVTRTGAEAPDVVLCDIELHRDADGLEVVRAAVSAGRPTIVLTSHERSSFMREAFELGAVGFLGKTTAVDEIVAAIRLVAEGGTVFPASVVGAVRSAPRVPSTRERAVISLVAAGASNDEIGARLGISTRTVESHLRRMFDRYATLSRTELVVRALAEGWVSDAGR